MKIRNSFISNSIFMPKELKHDRFPARKTGRGVDDRGGLERSQPSYRANRKDSTVVSVSTSCRVIEKRSARKFRQCSLLLSGPLRDRIELFSGRAAYQGLTVRVEPYTHLLWLSVSALSISFSVPVLLDNRFGE
eukprot:1196260-Prorocentrum_minimum.AAC.7